MLRFHEIELYRDDKGVIRRWENYEPFEIQDLPIDADDCLTLDLDVAWINEGTVLRVELESALLNSGVLPEKTARRIWEKLASDVQEAVLASQ
jgi:hypothetical protein